MQAPDNIFAEESGATLRQPQIHDYHLLRMIGRGGYGDVWIARGLTGALRAVKIVWRDRFEDAEPFDREFRGLKEFMAISLAEEGQLALLHAGNNEEAGFFYYVMELADDATRGQQFDPRNYVPLTAKELKTRQGRLPAGECLKLGVELARALAGLHARGLLHRDIKPSNVIFVNGVPRLADIGLVAATDRANTFVGTPGFVPPEGPGAKAADVFALGKVLYELATGRDGEEFPQLPDELGPPEERAALFELNEIILKACEPEGARRYQDGAALLADLAALQAGRSLRRKRGGRGKAWLAAGAVVAAVIAGVALARVAGPASVTAVSVAPAPVLLPPSIMVLPFANLSSDKDNEYFSEGVSEELLNVLAKVPGLKVAARSSSFYYKDHPVPLAEMAQKLGVAYVLEGSVRKAGDRVRITVNLIKAADGFEVFSQTYDRDLKDIFSTQDEIAGLALAQVRPALFPDATANLAQAEREIQRISRGGTKNVEAYRLMLEGRHVLREFKDDTFSQAAEFFKKAVQLDPDFALGWANLAYAYAWMYSSHTTPFAETAPFALAAAKRAIALAPDLAEAHGAMSEAGILTWDWALAIREFHRAFELAPANADILQTGTWVYLVTGDMEASILYAYRALEVDPFNRAALYDLILALNSVGRYDEAEKIAKRLIETDPGESFAAWPLFQVLVQRGSFKQLDDQLKKPIQARCAYDADYFGTILAYAAGKQRESDDCFKRFKANRDSYYEAALHAYRQEPDAAFAKLEEARAGKISNIVMIKHEPMFARLHADPRWPELLRKMGLADDQLK